MGALSCIIRAILIAGLWCVAPRVLGQASAQFQAKADVETLTIGYLNTGGACDSQITVGIRRAIDVVNSKPGITKPRVKLLMLDPPDPWRDIGSQLARLLFENRIAALIGPTRGKEAHVVAQIATRARIPVITLDGEDDLTHTFDPWIFRGIPSDSEQAKHLLRWTKKQSRTQAALAVVPEGRAGRERVKALQKAGRDLGVALEFITPDEGIEDTMTLKPATVLLWLDPTDAVRWMKQIQNRFEPEFLLGSLRLIHPEVIAATSRCGLKLWVPNLGDCSKSKDVGEGTVWEAVGFDMANAIVQATHWNGLTPGGIRAGLQKQETITGQTGLFHFDALGNRSGNIRAAMIERGRLTCDDDSK